MTRLQQQNIESDPDRCGGQPVVVGTRIRAATIVAATRLGMGIDEILAEYPMLTRADVANALDYARRHPEAIASALADDDEAAAKTRVRGAAES